jgi:rubrerythrin
MLAFELMFVLAAAGALGAALLAVVNTIPSLERVAASAFPGVSYRIEHGLCVACGYDLHGGTDQRSCPECGVPEWPFPPATVR